MASRGGGARRRAPAIDPSAVTRAVLLATARASDGTGAAALIPWEGGTLLARLERQVAALGVADVRVITRPQWVEEIAGATTATVEASPSVEADLRLVADLADASDGALVLVCADLVTHGETLAGLLKDPRIATGVVTGRNRFSRQFAFRVRASRGRILSAASPFHAVHGPTGSFLGVLKVAAADLPGLAAAARELAGLVAAPGAEWEEEFGRKTATLACRAGAHRRSRRPGVGRRRRRSRRARGARGGAGRRGRRAVRRRRAVPPDAPRRSPRGRPVAAARRPGPSGAHVGVSRLRRLYWGRPMSAEAARDAEERITGYDEDKVLLDSAVKATDGFFTTFFVSPYSRYIARWAARRGLTPNQVTTASVLIGLVAAICFATGERWGLIAGALLVQLSFTTDCVDGQLARYTRTFSKLGAWLDSIFDRTKEYMAFAGLAIGASQMGDDAWLLACCALTLQTVRHSADFSYGAAQTQKIGETEHPPVERARDAAGIAAEQRRLRALERGPVAAAPPPAPGEGVAAAPRAAAVAPDRPGRRRALDQEDDRVPDRRAVRGHLDHGGALHPARDVHRPARLGRRGDRVHHDRPRAAVHRPMSAAAAAGAAAPPAEPPEALLRDDGPLARAAGRAAARLPVPGLALLLAGNAALLAAAAIAGADASDALVAAVVAWLVLTVGATSTRWPRASFQWAVPPLVRLAEYGTIVWIGAVADAEPARVRAARRARLPPLRPRLPPPPSRRGPAAVAERARRGLGRAPADRRGCCSPSARCRPACSSGRACSAVASLAETVAAWRSFERGARPAEYDDPEDEGG